MTFKLHRANDLEEISRYALSRIRERAEQSGERFSLALAGGSTPRHLYRLMSLTELPWSRFEFWFGDERYVPHQHSDSNYRMARETLLDSLKDGEVHPWPYLNSAEASAEAYNQRLKERFGEGPTFDLVLLGLGDDGHTASLFPNTEALRERDQLAVANWVEKLNSWRLTLTYPAFRRAKEILFLVSGSGKAEALAEVMAGRLPSAQVSAHQTVVVADREARSGL